MSHRCVCVCVCVCVCLCVVTCIDKQCLLSLEANLVFLKNDRSAYLLTGFQRCSPPLPEVLNANLFAVKLSQGPRDREVANTGVSCSDGDITDGNSCHYECHDGYRLSGSPVMRCEQSGDWLGSVPSCIGQWRPLTDTVCIKIGIVYLRTVLLRLR